MKSNVTDLTMQKLHETEGAVLVTLGMPDEAVWLPKSKVEIEPSDTEGLVTVTLPEWLATERGLV